MKKYFRRRILLCLSFVSLQLLVRSLQFFSFTVQAANRQLPTYKTPLVEGKTILSASRFTAIFIAFAKALNIASIL